MRAKAEDFFLLPGINSPFFDLGSRFLPCKRKQGGVFYDRRFAIGNQLFFEFFVTFMRISEGKLEAHEKNNYFETVSFSARKNSKRSKNQRLRGILQAF